MTYILADNLSKTVDLIAQPKLVTCCSVSRLLTTSINIAFEFATT